MTNKLYEILKGKEEVLKQLQQELRDEYSWYADKDDFDAIVLLRAIESLGL